MPENEEKQIGDGLLFSTSERINKMDLLDWLNTISDLLELRHMNTQEHRHQMVLRLLMIPAAIIVSLIAFIIYFFERG